MLPTEKGELISWLPSSFFTQSPEVCARALIGCRLHCGSCTGVVIETEAYASKNDEACHTFFRPSTREFVSEREAGTAYVYLNYGVHWLANVLTKNADMDGFVLLRALEPSEGLAIMRRRRRKKKIEDLCSGPGKLTQAFGITGKHHGSTFQEDERLAFSSAVQPVEVLADKRVGISRERNRLWRFLAKDHPGVSVPFGRVK